MEHHQQSGEFIFCILIYDLHILHIFTYFAYFGTNCNIDLTYFAYLFCIFCIFVRYFVTYFFVLFLTYSACLTYYSAYCRPAPLAVAGPLLSKVHWAPPLNLCNPAFDLILCIICKIWKLIYRICNKICWICRIICKICNKYAKYATYIWNPVHLVYGGTRRYVPVWSGTYASGDMAVWEISKWYVPVCTDIGSS
jgi:hypothetical protein